MPTINKLPLLDTISGGDQLPVYSPNAGDARRMSINSLADYMQDVITPDNAANITYDPAGTGAVARTVQSKLRESVSVLDFGAKGDGVTDDTAAIQAAIDAVAAGTTLFFPVGDYLVSNLTVDKPIGFRGDGVAGLAASGTGAYLSGVRIKAKAAATGYLFTVTLGSIQNSEGHNFGVQFRNIYLFGNNRGSDIGAVKISITDYFVFEDVFAESFQREAINFYAGCREGSITRLRTRFCGTRNTAGTSYPTISLVDTGLGDNHNGIRFIDCAFVYSMGDTVNIDKTAASSTTVRQIFFDQCLFHGILYFIDSVPYTFTADMKACTHIVNKGGDDIEVANSTFLFAGDNKPHIYQGTATAGTYPGVTLLKNNVFTNHYSLTSLGYGAEAVTGKIFSQGNQWYTSLSGAISVSSGAYHQINNDYFGLSCPGNNLQPGSIDATPTITFTPTLVASGGGTPTYVAQEGRAVRTGNVINYTARIILSSVGTLVGSLRISGLPYPIKWPGLSTPSFYFTGANAAVVNMVGRIQTATPNDISLFYINAGNASGLDASLIGSSLEVIATGSYIAE